MLHEKSKIIFSKQISLINESSVIRSVLHEFEHTHQNEEENEEYRKLGYDNNPNEIAARKAERKWRKYLDD